ncbi:MAG: FmdB family zinc ribbon protein [Planctomycetaceae bacterium]
MPTYDYRCSKCNHEWEVFQSIKAEPEKKCPACGKRTAKRVIGPGAGILFKGSGFYLTDYRSEGYKKAAAADKKASEGGSSGGSSSGGESNSSAKPESKPAASKSE